jgi:hypothetical protein
MVHARLCLRFSPWWPFRQGLSIALFGGVLILPACGPSFQQMAAAECQGVRTDTAYAECERRLSQELAEERLGYIMRSQVTGGPAGRLRP